MNLVVKRRLIVAISIFFGVSAMLGLLLYSMSQNIDFFYTPSEIINGKVKTGVKPEVGQRLRVGGMVVKGSVKHHQTNDNSLAVSFKLFDSGDPQISVHYKGLLPDLFREEQGIVATGILISPTELQAHEVLAKHDENYMPPELVDAAEKAHNKNTKRGEQ